jgi:hypothetical protein
LEYFIETTCCSIDVGVKTCKEHKVSEIGSVSLLRRRDATHSVGSVRK